MHRSYSTLASVQYTSFSICSFNCEGVHRTVDYMNEFVCNNLCDILCLQETWLIEQNLPHLANIHSDYLYTGKSGVDSNSDILVGRPKGGVAILYKKSVACGVIIHTLHGFNILVLCTYAM